MRKSDRTRQRIIEQAALIFNIKGIAGTSVGDVIDTCGISKGSLYSHFKNKEELSYVITDHLLSKMTGKLVGIIAHQVSAVDKIHAFLKYNIDPLNFFIDGGNPATNFSTEADDTSPVISGKIKMALESHTSLLMEILRDGIQAGELSASLPVEEFALKIYCAIEGAGSYSRILKSSRPMRAIVRNLKNELNRYRIGDAIKPISEI